MPLLLSLLGIAVDRTDAALEASTVNAEDAVEIATKFSYTTAERLHAEWVDFHGELFTIKQKTIARAIRLPYRVEIL